MTTTMTERRELRILGVKVEGPDDLGRVVSALGNAGEKGSVEYTLGRKALVAAARELGPLGLKALPADWGVTEDTDGLEYKAFPATATNILNEAEGIVEAFVAVSGVEDKGADIIYPEALDYALNDRTPKGVWHHDWKQPIARTLAAKALPPGDPALPRETRDGQPWPAEAGALWVKSQFNLGTTRGKDAFNDVAFFGEDQEWSVGYRVPRGGAKVDKFGVRHIKQMVIPEYSPVLFGMHPLTSTSSVKDENAVAEHENDAKDETKSGTIRVFLAGSLEELIDEITDEVEEWLQSPGSGIDMTQCWARVVGTFADSATAGNVVFCVMTYNGYDGETGDDTPDLDDDDNYFRAPWTIDATGECMLGTVEVVDIQAIVVAEAAGDLSPVEAAVLADQGKSLETKVGKMISRANMGKLKAAHGALTELLSSAEPKEAKIELSDDEKAEKAEQVHPYLANDGKCSTCGLSDKAAVHVMNLAGKDEGENLIVSITTADGADPAQVAEVLRGLAEENQAKADATGTEAKAEVSEIELLRLQRERLAV